jgi:hypothetical protein
MYIRPSFVNNCLTNLLSGSTPHPLPCVKVQYIQKVIGCEGGGVLSPVGDHILQELNTLYLTKLLDHPNKNLGGKRASDR